ncbi:MAG: hypothetical protein J6J31_07165 [Thermoguttaceae bacterium]|nr:hypothetical protein [Thermoguttaceae bacterium]
MGASVRRTLRSGIGSRPDPCVIAEGRWETGERLWIEEGPREDGAECRGEGAECRTDGEGTEWRDGVEWLLPGAECILREGRLMECPPPGRPPCPPGPPPRGPCASRGSEREKAQSKSTEMFNFFSSFILGTFRSDPGERNFFDSKKL